MSILHWVIDLITTHWQWLFAVVGSLIGCKAAYDYLKADIDHQAQPYRWTWMVWLVGFAGGTYFAYKAHAGYAGVTLSGVATVLVAAVTVLAWIPGYGHKGLERWYHPRSLPGLWPCMVEIHPVTLVGVLLRPTTAVAVIAAIVADFTATRVQWYKSRDDAESEVSVADGSCWWSDRPPGDPPLELCYLGFPGVLHHHQCGDRCHDLVDEAAGGYKHGRGLMRMRALRSRFFLYQAELMVYFFKKWSGWWAILDWRRPSKPMSCSKFMYSAPFCRSCWAIWLSKARLRPG